ncbi:hypothetical protein F4859DRAFT_241909 [Xylaria cf. heliscus]|nr:hypothetical protein F4859DRAFT_241909 [Xylaria cf. heliscus]
MWSSRGRYSWSQPVAVAAHDRSQAAARWWRELYAIGCGYVRTRKGASSRLVTEIVKRTRRTWACSRRRGRAMGMTNPCGRRDCCGLTWLEADAMFELFTGGVWCSSILCGFGFGLLWLTSLVGIQFNTGRGVMPLRNAHEQQRNGTVNQSFRLGRPGRERAFCFGVLILLVSVR